jgi:calcyphosin
MHVASASKTSTSSSLSNLLGISETTSAAKVIQYASSAGPYAAAGTAKESVNLKSSSQVRDTLFNDRSANPSLYSATQEYMLSGIDNSIGDASKVGFTTEQRLVREQILAALRRLRAREITLSDFQERVYNLGIDLPDVCLSELRRAESNGELDYKKCVSLLDSEIFKTTALYDGPSSNEINQIKDKLMTLLSKSGSSSILLLQKTFRDMDTDHTDSLSFSEFLQSCRSLGLSDKSVSDTELRSLFLSFDQNGDGELQYDEFMDSLRGTLNPKRRKIVQNAFLKLDSRGRTSIPVIDVVKSMIPKHHSDVIQGMATAEKVLGDMIDFFSKDEKQNYSKAMVAMDDFIDYYSNISPFVESDEIFVDCVKKTWNMGDQAPPPPVIVPHSNHGVSELKDGKQVKSLYKLLGHSNNG